VRYPPGHRYRTHARIVETAGRLFKKGGFAATSVDTVMEAVGLTAGGFYSHFRSKDALFAESLDVALGGETHGWKGMFADQPDSEWLRGFLSAYLSASHRDSSESGCTISCLAPDVARAGKVPRGVFERHVGDYNEHMARKLHKRAPLAYPIFALAVGGLVLSRAVANRETADAILDSCRAAALRLAGLPSR
jgi:TetR/AcrR family transcriptional repressor of nem operon